MLDCLAIHIAEPEAAVRCIREGHGPKPIIPAGEEFGFLFAGRTSRAELNVTAEFLAMD